MGNLNFPCNCEPSSQNSRNNDIVKQQTKHEIAQDCQAPQTEQFDNPSRVKPSEALLKTSIKTSDKAILSFGNYQPQISDNTTCLQLNTPPMGISKSNLQSKKLIQNKQNVLVNDVQVNRREQRKRTSVEKLQLYNTNSLESLKDFNTTNLMSDFIIQTAKTIHDPITIQLQKFVQIHKEPIGDHYELQEKVGQGSYGCVYKAKCLKTGDLRAIKVLKKAMQTKEKNIFMAQMELLKKLDHPNIIKLYEIFLHNNFYYVVMEYCCGGTIIDFLSRSGKYSEQIVKLIVYQILSAIRYMHQQKIVHRDVKLENMVFLNEINEINAVRGSRTWNQLEDVCIKLIDFGTAIKLKYSKNTSKSKVGTTSYMSPEMIDGSYNDKCDVWSAGVILYILLSGKSPFKSRSRQQTFFKIKMKKITCEQPQWENVSEEAKQLVILMLQKDYKNRLSAQKCLEHRWFEFERQGRSNRRSKRATTIVLNNLSNYYRQNNLVSVIQSFLAFRKISQKQRQQLAKVFQKLDQDNSGSIDVSELTEAYMQYHGNGDKEEVLHVLNKIDKNKSGKIDFSQFIAAVYGRKKLFVKSSLLQAFDFLDTGKSGFLDKSDLKNALKGCQKAQIEDIMSILDEDKDNKISKEQFVDYFISLN